MPTQSTPIPRCSTPLTYDGVALKVVAADVDAIGVGCILVASVVAKVAVLQVHEDVAGKIRWERRIKIGRSEHTQLDWPRTDRVGIAAFGSVQHNTGPLMRKLPTRDRVWDFSKFKIKSAEAGR